ncbi:hypothetical protein BDP27DRAFT_1366984 [Rhodocollybia butyracea]|uniref:Uncharacterized protein n=1 Tax=Rhodocollybia butyracea TaxID=206335 RepID=A0A9P5PJX1_9AGAR|nr:hypothetical protein BDP27DRAFT_1366984 [Rhodocollybia butyracea]
MPYQSRTVKLMLRSYTSSISLVLGMRWLLTLGSIHIVCVEQYSSTNFLKNLAQLLWYYLRTTMSTGYALHYTSANRANSRYTSSLNKRTMPNNDIISEAIGHMITGSSVSASYLLWKLSRHYDMSLYPAAPGPLDISSLKIFTQTEAVNAGFDLLGFELPSGPLLLLDSLLRPGRCTLESNRSGGRLGPNATKHEAGVLNERGVEVGGNVVNLPSRWSADTSLMCTSL